MRKSFDGNSLNVEKSNIDAEESNEGLQKEIEVILNFSQLKRVRGN